METRTSTGPKLAPLAASDGPAKPPSPANVWQAMHLVWVKSFLPLSKLRSNKPSRPSFSFGTSSASIHFLLAAIIGVFLRFGDCAPADFLEALSLGSSLIFTSLN